MSPAPRPSSRDSRGVRSPASRDPPEPSPRRGGVPWNRVGAGSGATSFASKSPLSTEFAERVENEDGDDNPRRDERPRPCAERLRLPGSRSRKVSGAVPRPPTADDEPGASGPGARPPRTAHAYPVPGHRWGPGARPWGTRAPWVTRVTPWASHTCRVAVDPRTVWGGRRPGTGGKPGVTDPPERLRGPRPADTAAPIPQTAEGHAGARHVGSALEAHDA